MTLDSIESEMIKFLIQTDRPRRSLSAFRIGMASRLHSQAKSAGNSTRLHSRGDLSPKSKPVGSNRESPIPKPGPAGASLKVRTGSRADSSMSSPRQGGSPLRDAQAASDERRELVDRYNELCELLKQKHGQRDQLIAQKARLAAPRDDDQLRDTSTPDEAAAAES
jgi:hypothetical protein